MFGSTEHDEDPRGERAEHGPGEAGDEESRLSARLWYLLMLMRRGDAELRHGERRAGGFQGQGRVLRLLALHSPIAQKELAYLLGIRSQSLAEQIGKLEEAGLIERRPNPEDRRSSLVELTARGRETVEEEGEQTEAGPFSVLDEEEQRQLTELLDRVIEGMEERLPEGPDPRMRMFKQRAFGFGGGMPERGFPGFGPGMRGGFGPGMRGRWGGRP
jgi:DNA-binding MarR family transcriptional regulator